MLGSAEHGIGISAHILAAKVSFAHEDHDDCGGVNVPLERTNILEICSVERRCRMIAVTACVAMVQRLAPSTSRKMDTPGISRVSCRLMVAL